MKVLLVNGSPHRDGCTFTSLSEVAGALNKNGVESEIFWIGNRAIQGCISCWKCHEEGADGCVFREKLYTDFVMKMKESDALIIGAPVYYAGPPGGSLRDSRPGVFLGFGIFPIQTRCLRGQLSPRWSERDI